MDKVLNRIICWMCSLRSRFEWLDANVQKKTYAGRALYTENATLDRQDDTILLLPALLFFASLLVLSSQKRKTWGIDIPVN